MASAHAEVGFKSRLQTRLIRQPAGKRGWAISIPKVGRVMVTRDPGSAALFASEYFATHLTALHRDGDGKLIQAYDLGSGQVTNVGVLALANDWQVPEVAGAGAGIHTLGPQLKFIATGIGAAAESTFSIKLGTLSAPTTVTAVTGVQSTISAANVQKFQVVGTVSYTSSLAITEFGLHNLATLTAATGSPFTAGTGTTGTVTATPLTASSTTAQGQTWMVFNNTGNATPSWGFVTSNTTSVVTVPAWYKTSDGTVGSNPANTNVYEINPVLWDRKNFAAINVVNGDSIQFTYSLTVNSGG